MSNECTSCTAPVETSFLCSRCCGDLRDLLASLLPRYEGGAYKDGGVWREVPAQWRKGLLDYLQESSVGETRLGDTGRRMKHSSSLHGDEHADALYVHESGRTASGGRYSVEYPRFTLNRVLAAGKVNCKASDLAEEIRDCLGQWATFVRGGVLPVPPSWSRPVSEYRHTSVECARFLKDHIAELSNLEDVGELVHELRKYVRRAENIINRPPSPLPLGLCPTVIDRGRLGKSNCNTRLEAHHNVTSVVCPQCNCPYEVKWLREEALRRASHEPKTRSQILRVIAGFKDVVGGSLPAGTFDVWCSRKQITPVGWVDRSGVLHEAKLLPSDRPVYSLDSVIERMAQSATKQGVVA